MWHCARRQFIDPVRGKIWHRAKLQRSRYAFHGLPKHISEVIMEPRARGMSERKLLEDASVQGGDAMQDLVTNGKQLFHKFLFR